jgi:hypothetical protein
MFPALLEKVGFSMGRRALSSLLFKMGYSESMATAVGFLVTLFLAQEFWHHMMPPTGPNANSTTEESSSSGSWTKYLNLSNESEVDQTTGPQALPAPNGVEQPQGGEAPNLPREQSVEVNQPGPVASPVEEAGPSEPNPAPVESPPLYSPSLYSPSEQEFEVLRQLFSPGGASIEQQQPVAQEALPQAPAPAPDPFLIKTLYKG